MALRIATNTSALSAQRYLNTNHEAQNRSLEHLASGSRINRAGDDAAGLAVSEKMRASIRSMGQASRNASDGVSMIQVAEGAMNEVSNILVRVRELSIQAASDTISDTERAFVEKEVTNLKSEVNRIAGVTEFNGIKLLNGSAPDLDIQIGIHNKPEEDRLVFDSTKQVTTLESLGISDVSVLTKEQAQGNMQMVDGAISRLNENRAGLGALQNRLTSTINNLNTYKENLEGARSRIFDTDMASESSELTKQSILSQAGISTLAQANQTPQMALKLLG